MRELAGDQVDHGEQMGVRAKAPCPVDGQLDTGIDRLGGAVGQVQTEAVDDAGQMLAYRGAEALERRQPTAP